MIIAKKQKQALNAIHRILVLARFMAYQNEPTAKIAKVLDYAEILPTLISADDDRTEEFGRTFRVSPLSFRRDSASCRNSSNDS